MDITDLSELCRLCLDSPTTLFSFDVSLSFTKRSLPQLIKYCIDIDCSANDGGIAPRNVCQACLDKLTLVQEFKQKSHESEKVIKQIISHSSETATIVVQDEEVSITPYHAYTVEDDVDSLLEPLDVNSYKPKQTSGNKRKSQHINLIVDQPDVQQPQPSGSKRRSHHGSSLNEDKDYEGPAPKGTRHGDFECRLCRKFFKYIKPYKNHMKLHKNTLVPLITAARQPKLSYYKRKKLEKEAASVIPNRPTRSSVPESNSSNSFQQDESEQADYDSLSPYNSPGPYENEHNSTHNSRDSSPDFGALMLSTSEYIGNEVLEEAEKETTTRKSRTGKSVKRPILDIADNDDEDETPTNGQKRTRNRSTGLASSLAATKKAIPAPSRKSEIPPPAKKPGPLFSKTRTKAPPKSNNDHDSSDKINIAGFSEVDISKVLRQKSRNNDILKLDEDNSNQSSYKSNRSRRESRSPSVELIQEVDIFDKG